MADLFNDQAKQYSETRPSYPPELFQFISSKTPSHNLAWDVGTGSGQSAKSLAGIYNNVVATDTSQEQLAFASKLPNIRYQQTLPIMSIDEVEQQVARQASVDVVTVAQALHWIDLPNFYQQVNWVLKRPHGVIAVWCYIEPEVSDSVDDVFWRVYRESGPYWAPARKLVDDKYQSIHFPFEPVEETDHTGPFKFESNQSMNLDIYLSYIRSWSAYQTARKAGVELLREDVIEDFKRAWGDDGRSEKVVRFPVYLRMGKVGAR